MKNRTLLWSKISHELLNLVYSCALVKSKQKKVRKETASKSAEKVERLYIDISSARTKSLGGTQI